MLAESCMEAPTNHRHSYPGCVCLQAPELTAWRGASAFAVGDNYWQCVRTKQQYDEQGPSVAKRER